MIGQALETNAQQLTEATAGVGVITALLHPLWCYLLVFSLDMGYLGAAYALSLTRFLEGLLLTVYIIIYYEFQAPFVLSLEAFQQWGTFLALGAPNVLMNSQWWAEEVGAASVSYYCNLLYCTVLYARSPMWLYFVYCIL